MLFFGLAALGAVMPSPALAGSPVWKLTVASEPTNFTPGAVADTGPAAPTDFGGYPEYDIIATNVGSAPSEGPITITDTLPAGLTPLDPVGRDSGIDGLSLDEFPCSAFAETVICTDPGPVGPGRYVQVAIPVAVGPGVGPALTNDAAIAGGGGGEARAATTTSIDASPAAFGLVSGNAGFSQALSTATAAPLTQASSHPFQETIDNGFTTMIAPDGNLISAGSPRALQFNLPAGMTLNPTATALCSEAQLAQNGCPDASAVGFAALQTVRFSAQIGASPIYNMVPPQGAIAEFGMNPFGIDIFVHLMVGLRSPAGNELSIEASELPARRLAPVISVQSQLWGDPSDPAHDGVRGQCAFYGGSCPVAARPTAFLTMPGTCGVPLTLDARVESWEEPAGQTSSAQSEGPLGETVKLEGCNKLDFDPAIEARPTTNLSDAPSGLQLSLRLAQNTDLDRLAAAGLKEVRLSLPAGMAPNPSFAAGVSGCTQAQVALSAAAPARCPRDSTLGTVEVKTPLLDHPLPGALYLAKPYENPSDALLGLYLTLEDPASGVVIKLAGSAQADPSSTRLTASFKKLPQLPFEELELHLFGGPRAPLRTPPSCATYTIGALLTPQSTPEGADAHRDDRFAITAAPGGGDCPDAAAALAHRPSFEAGTTPPSAGARPAFGFKLARPDGTQTLAGFQTTLPRGLLADLSATGYCSEAQISSARARGKPGGGRAEQGAPSCPAASRLGRLEVSAGAGIAPARVPGQVYLAGPYKGAPLSLVAITPAIAGPFDLGTVVVRLALMVDPKTAQVRAISDPLPEEIDGIALDLRALTMALGPGLAANPTSCEPSVLSAIASSALGQSAALASPFQLGNCRSLDFSPRLSLRLGAARRGAHSSLRATLGFAAGRRANLAAAQITLPRSVSLARPKDAAICARAQFAAGHCPPSSVYGQATARTPLLARALHGPLYLRESARGPAELVARLEGQVEVTLAARIDSSAGRTRLSFGALPDAPLSKLVLRLNGAKGGLLVNRANLCRRPARAAARFEGQNGALAELRPRLGSPCASGARRQGGRR